MKLPKGFVYGRDYDGWALWTPGHPPRWSHFVGSPSQPSLPKGCVPVKLSQVCFIVVKAKKAVDVNEDADAYDEEKRRDRYRS